MPSVQPRFTPTPTIAEPVRTEGWDAGGPIGALHHRIEARLSGPVAAPHPAGQTDEPTVEKLVAGASRLAGPVALALAYALVVGLLR